MMFLPRYALDLVHPTASFFALGESNGDNCCSCHSCHSVAVDNPQMQSLVLYEAMNFWYLRQVFNPALKPGAR